MKTTQAIIDAAGRYRDGEHFTVAALVQWAWSRHGLRLAPAVAGDIWRRASVRDGVEWMELRADDPALCSRQMSAAIDSYFAPWIDAESRREAACRERLSMPYIRTVQLVGAM